MKDCGAIPDSAEYWWPNHKNISNKELFGKRNIKPHDCKPRGGLAGTPFRRFCSVCSKAFSKHSINQFT